MILPARLRSWLKWMMQRPRPEREMETEMRSHIDSFAEEHSVDRGPSLMVEA